MGPDPENTGNVAHEVNGTSFASPYAAGVAALVVAANPDLSADEVEDILIDTAHSSSDSEVGRYVNAAAAVHTALGDIAPNLEIISPDNGSSRQLNFSVNFWAQVDDFEDGQNCCDIVWTSDVDGELHVGSSFSHIFATAGKRVITATTEDSYGVTTTKVFTLNIVNTAPTVEITKPSNAEEVFRDTPYTVKGTSYDPNETGTSLLCYSMQWTSSNATDLLGTGCQLEVTFSSNGSRRLTLTGFDSEGSTGSDMVTITVVEPPVDLPPQVQISSPTNGASIQDIYAPMSLSATVSDDNDVLSDLHFVWTVTHNNTTTKIGSVKDINWTPSDTIDFSTGEGRYDLSLTLTVTDTAAKTGSDFVKVYTIIID